MTKIENTIMPPLAPDTTPGDSYNEHDNGLLREEMAQKLCLPVIVEPLCLANETDAKNDDKYTVG